MPRWCPGARCCGDAGTVLQWLREAAHFLQDGMRVSCVSAEHEGEEEAERSCAGWGAFSGSGALSPGGDAAMGRTWRARVGQAAGVVQAGVVQTGPVKARASVQRMGSEARC